MITKIASKIGVSLNKIVDAINSLVISIGGDDADYVCRVSMTAGQSIPNGAFTKIQFNVKDYDPNNDFDNSANFDYKVPKTGYYQINGAVALSNTGDGIRMIVHINKNDVSQASNNTSTGKNTENSAIISDILYLEKGNKITLTIYQDSGVAKDVFNTPSETFLSIAKINKYSGGGSQPNGEGWHTVQTLSNSWVNYGISTNLASYFKDQFGVIHLKGFVKNGTIGQAIFTLPDGYRPNKNDHHVVIANDAIGRCLIEPNGQVKAEQGSNTWFSLDGITFRADGY